MKNKQWCAPYCICFIVIGSLLVSACESDTDSDKACFEAARAQAEVMGRLHDVHPNSPTETLAWDDAIAAATEWKKKACSNTKGEFNDKVQKHRQFEAQQLRQREAK